MSNSNSINNSTSAGSVATLEKDSAAARVRSLFDDALALLEAGKFPDALRVCQLALETHREVLGGRPDDDISAEILNIMGIACDEIGQHDAALAAKSEAVQIRRRVFVGVDDERLALSLYNLGVTFQRRSRDDDALLQFTESLEMSRRLANGADSDTLAESMGAVGMALSRLTRNEEALSVKRDALAMQRRLSAGRDSEELSTAMASLAVTLGRLSRDPEEVRALEEESLNMKRRLAGGKDDEDLAILICNMGVSMQDAGDLASALRLFAESYEMLMRLFPTGHRAAASDLCNIGRVLLMKEETRDEGESKIDEGLAMFRHLGGDSPEYVIGLRDCGAGLVKIGRLEKGEQLLKEADEMTKRIAEVADVATAAAAFSTTTPAQQVDMSGVSRSNYPQPRSETQPTASDVSTSVEKNADSAGPSSSYAPSSSAVVGASSTGPRPVVASSADS